MNKDLIRKGVRIFLVASAIFVTVFFGYIFIGLVRIIYFPPVSAFMVLTEVNESDVEGGVMHLTQNDLNASRPLEYLVQNGHEIMTGEEWDNLKSKYSSRGGAGSPEYLEYQGKYYLLSVRIHRGEQ